MQSTNNSDDIVAESDKATAWHSARVRVQLEKGGALAARTPVGDDVGEDLDYSIVRQTGLPLGYNIFKSPPPPPEFSSGPSPLIPSGAAWYVDISTLESSDPGSIATGLATTQRAQRQRDAQTLMRTNPTMLLVDEAQELNEAAQRLKALDDRVEEALEGTQAGQAAIAAGKGNAKALIASGNAARQMVVQHTKARAEVDLLAAELDATWRKLQSEGTDARKAALARMAEIEDGLQLQLEEVELRLTDHVLLGTAEEAERMLRAPGPDGDQLRAIVYEKAALAERQRLQKAVLVQVARKAVSATGVHEARMSKARSRLDHSAVACATLAKASDALNNALSKLTGKDANLMEVAAAAELVSEMPKVAGGAKKGPSLYDTRPNIAQRTGSAVILNEMAPLGSAAPPIEYLVVREPSNQTTALGWVAKLVEIQTSGPVLSIGLARDDHLPSIVIDSGLLERTRQAVAKSVLPAGKPSSSIRGKDKVLDLASALVVARVDDNGPSAGKVRPQGDSPCAALPLFRPHVVTCARISRSTGRALRRHRRSQWNASWRRYIAGAAAFDRRCCVVDGRSH